jgi:hypothetical protein
MTVIAGPVAMYLPPLLPPRSVVSAAYAVGTAEENTMSTTRLNPIEALLAEIAGVRPEDAVACGNWARMNASAAARSAAAGLVITVDPVVLAAAAARAEIAAARVTLAA